MIHTIHFMTNLADSKVNGCSVILFFKKNETSFFSLMMLRRYCTIHSYLDLASLRCFMTLTSRKTKGMAALQGNQVEEETESIDTMGKENR